jgi:hypothetical protein
MTSSTTLVPVDDPVLLDVLEDRLGADIAAGDVARRTEAAAVERSRWNF